MSSSRDGRDGAGSKLSLRNEVGLRHLTDDELLAQLLDEAPRQLLQSGELAEAMERLENMLAVSMERAETPPANPDRSGRGADDIE